MVLVRAAKEHGASAIVLVHAQSWLKICSGIVPDDYLASLNAAEQPQPDPWPLQGYGAELLHFTCLIGSRARIGNGPSPEACGIVGR